MRQFMVEVGFVFVAVVSYCGRGVDKLWVDADGVDGVEVVVVVEEGRGRGGGG
jgi:hypothetical protein